MPPSRNARPASDSASRTGTCPPPSMRCCMRRSKAQILESARQRAGEGDRPRDLRLPLRFVPEFELLPLAHQHDTLVETGITAQRRGDQNSTGSVEIDIVRMTDDQPLQAADRVIER